ncbi:hypothetical protein DFJ74DRAFT_689410 [Hyaloraphidium curvatum]|nr:hypothetical protein DFJ74DRAFT_689410 [Hyaloraphidium curvatum]
MRLRTAPVVLLAVSAVLLPRTDAAGFHGEDGSASPAVSLPAGPLFPRQACAQAIEECAQSLNAYVENCLSYASAVEQGACVCSAVNAAATCYADCNDIANPSTDCREACQTFPPAQNRLQEACNEYPPGIPSAVTGACLAEALAAAACAAIPATCPAALAALFACTREQFGAVWEPSRLVTATGTRRGTATLVVSAVPTEALREELASFRSLMGQATALGSKGTPAPTPTGAVTRSATAALTGASPTPTPSSRPASAASLSGSRGLNLALLMVILPIPWVA